MQLPLLFSFQQVVFGNGFTADVNMNGRALLEEREGTAECASETWISGVAPISISGGGADRSVAYVEFRNAWVSVLFDIAAEAASFDDFKRECQAFLESSAPHLTKEWDESLAACRRSKYIDPKLPSKPVVPVTFSVVDITGKVPNPTANTIEVGLRAAA